MCPINVYGRSKAKAEKSIREILPSCCILRTSWLFGAHGRCFSNTILEFARDRKKLRVVADQIGSPTYNRDLAHAIVKLVRAEARGIIHATNAGECSWCDFARELLSRDGFANVTVEAVRTEDIPRPARRPRYSVFSIATLEPYGIPMRLWQATLGDYFADRHRTSKDLPAVFPGPAVAGSLRADSGEDQ